MGLGHLLALVVGNVLASSINGSPHLVIALSLPLVLAVLLVLGGALGLSVRLVLGPVLLHTDVVVDGGALLLVLLVALLPCGGLAQPLGPGVALLLVHRGAHLLLLLLVLCVLVLLV